MRGPRSRAGKKSLALRLSFRAADRTLSEDEVNELRGQMLEKVGGAGSRTRGDAQRAHRRRLHGQPQACMSLARSLQVLYLMHDSCDRRS